MDVGVEWYQGEEVLGGAGHENGPGGGCNRLRTPTAGESVETLGRMEDDSWTLAGMPSRAKTVPH